MGAYIYKITDTRNGKAVVGKHNGKQNSYYTSSLIINKIIAKHGDEKAKKFLKREIIVEGDFNELLLAELEKHYIRLYNTKTPYGYNLTDGGEGACGLVHKKEVLHKLSESMKKNWQDPIFREERTKLIVAGNGKDIGKKERHSKLMSKLIREGKIFASEKFIKAGVECIKRKCLLISAFTGEIINEFESVISLKRYIGTQRSNRANLVIKKSENGEILIYIDKYILVYQELYKDEIKDKIDKEVIKFCNNNNASIKPCSKAIEQWTIDGLTYIKTWDSIVQAEAELGIKHAGCCARGDRNYAGGFKWKFTTDLTSNAMIHG